MQKNLLKNYENCVFCKSKIGKKKNYQIFEQNFYIDAIVSDLDPQKKNINKIRSYKCDNCKIIQNKPWFSEEISKKIYNEVYGQHNRNWQNIINYFNKGKLPDHGILFDILNKYIKIKNYAEFNSPFMGLMINFFAAEYNQSLKIKKNFLLIQFHI